MVENNSIFEKYNEENRTLKARMKNPKFWINTVLFIAVIVVVVIIFNSVKSTWNSGEVRKSVKLIWYDTEWQEVKTNFKDVMVRIVPVISIKIKNTGDKPLQYVDFEGVFEFESTGKTHTSGYAKGVSTPIMPGEMSGIITIKGMNGYTASSIRAFYDKIENWKKLRVKLFARTKGSPPTRIGGVYPVKQNIRGLKEFLHTDNPENEDLKNSLSIDSPVAEWIYKTLKTGDVIIYPVIEFRVKNIGSEKIDRLIFSGVFSFEKSGDRKQSGYPGIKNLLPGQTSKVIAMRAEFGIRVSSLQSLYNNIVEWEKVDVKVLVKNIKSNYILLGQFQVEQRVKGVKVIRN